MMSANQSHRDASAFFDIENINIYYILLIIYYDIEAYGTPIYLAVLSLENRFTSNSFGLFIKQIPFPVLNRST